MPSLNPFDFVANRHCSLFEIRLENDFVVFRGSGDEASGQLLKGVVVLCIKEPIKVEDVHLRFTGQSRIVWYDGKYAASNQKVDRTTSVMKNTWQLFSGDVNGSHLAAGNYEWPFEIMLPGNTTESVEGLFQTGVTYLFKATVTRGKLAKNLHAFKRLRIIRTLDPAALEFNHAMTVENIWPEKVEYSLGIPQKAVVFGSSVPLELRFSPLLKGLEIGAVTVKLVEIHDFSVSGTGIPTRTHKYEREVTGWNFEVSREKHWQETIEETGQEGWVVHQELSLPKRLHRCVQDCSVEGIKIRHKFKINVALNNPDGHISELRASLPVVIFISPNMPLDDNGNIVAQPQGSAEGNPNSLTNLAPPGYGQHVLDQLYDDVDISGILTPGMHSGVNSPFYAQSRAGSSENLAMFPHGSAITPAALSSRLLQTMTVDQNGTRHYTPHDGPGARTPQSHDHSHSHSAADSPQPRSAEMSRTASEDGISGRADFHTSPSFSEFPSVEQLSRVPSYGTATKTHLPRRTGMPGSLALPDYNAVTSAPSSPDQVISDPMGPVAEEPALEALVEREPVRSRSTSAMAASRSRLHGFSFLSSHALSSHATTLDNHDNERRLKHLHLWGGS